MMNMKKKWLIGIAFMGLYATIPSSYAVLGDNLLQFLKNLAQNVNALNENVKNLNNIDQKFQNLDQEFENLNQKINAQNQKLNEFQEETKKQIAQILPDELKNFPADEIKNFPNQIQNINDLLNTLQANIGQKPNQHKDQNLWGLWANHIGDRPQNFEGKTLWGLTGEHSNNFQQQNNVDKNIGDLIKNMNLNLEDVNKNNATENLNVSEFFRKLSQENLPQNIQYEGILSPQQKYSDQKLKNLDQSFNNLFDLHDNKEKPLLNLRTPQNILNQNDSDVNSQNDWNGNLGLDSIQKIKRNNNDNNNDNNDFNNLDQIIQSSFQDQNKSQKAYNRRKQKQSLLQQTTPNRKSSRLAANKVGNYKDLIKQGISEDN